MPKINRWVVGYRRDQGCRKYVDFVKYYSVNIYDYTVTEHQPDGFKMSKVRAQQLAMYVFEHTTNPIDVMVFDPDTMEVIVELKRSQKVKKPRY